MKPIITTSLVFVLLFGAFFWCIYLVSAENHRMEEHKRLYLNRPGVVTVYDQSGVEKKIYLTTFYCVSYDMVYCRLLNGKSSNFDYVMFPLKQIEFTDKIEK